LGNQLEVAKERDYTKRAEKCLLKLKLFIVVLEDMGQRYD